MINASKNYKCSSVGVIDFRIQRNLRVKTQHEFFIVLYLTVDVVSLNSLSYYLCECSTCVCNLSHLICIQNRTIEDF